MTWPIGIGKSLAGYVAHSALSINTSEMYTVCIKIERIVKLDFCSILSNVINLEWVLISE